MQRKIILLGLVTLLTVATLVPTGSAVAYEAELHDLAKRLILQLEAGNRRNAAVLDFTDLQYAPTELGRFLAQEFSDQLVAQKKRITIVDRDRIFDFLKHEENLASEGYINRESQQKIGRLIGVDTIISGTTTPLGNSVRLRVQAVAVETGEVIASQAVTLPVSGDLAELYSRGVAASPGGAIPKRARDARPRFRGDTINIISGQAMMAYAEIGTTFTIENRSGIPVGIGIVENSTSLGACHALSRLRGMNAYNDSQIQQIKAQSDPSQSLQYFPVGGKVAVAATIGRFQCPIQQGMNVDLTTSLIIAAEKQVFVLPASISIQVR